MATNNEKLATSLERLHALQKQGKTAIRSSDLSRTHRERLCQNGFLQEVVKGWYVPARPNDIQGESTVWYASYWQFCANYLENRMGENWCLSAEQSIALHVQNWQVPKQLIVRTSKARNNVTKLPHNTSLFDIKLKLPSPKDSTVIDGLRVYTLAAALVSSLPSSFSDNVIDMRTALAMIHDASLVLALLLDGGHSTIAGRLAGAFRAIGNDKIADNIIKTMQLAGYKIREVDPFKQAFSQVKSVQNLLQQSPYVQRIQILWANMRTQVIDNFPKPNEIKISSKAYFKRLEDIYTTDAYHSLSIEGYQVSENLINKVRLGHWNPDKNDSDGQLRNTMAARGYWQAFQAVRCSLEQVLNNKETNAATVAYDDHDTWYRELFAPSVTAGIIKASDLAGYRNSPVYIRQSMHIPPNANAVRDCMPAFFILLKNESHPAVRAVLGHFIFVYIHPYVDGNGRMARFLMNVMLASGHYNWLVVPVEKRQEYMQALEYASIDKDIIPLTRFFGRLHEDSQFNVPRKSLKGHES